MMRKQNGTRLTSAPIVLLLSLLGSQVPHTGLAAPVALDIVHVSAPAINCIFDLDCTIVVTDTTDQIVLNATAPGGTASFLQSRSFPPGESGTVAEGLISYLYRIDLRDLVGSGTPCVTSFSIEFGPAESVDYDDNGDPDDVYVVTGGGLGTVAPITATQVRDTITFSFGSGACAGDSPGNGDSTFFFGLTSAFPPHAVVAKVRDNLGGQYNLAARAPSLVWPLSGTAEPDNMNTSYGSRLNRSHWDFHNGIDLPGSTGTPIYAVRGGVVERAGAADGVYSSRHVVIRATDPAGTDMYHVYLHLDSIEAVVSAGADITRGQQIGTVGDDDATYSHLHFEVRTSPFQVDSVHPLSYLPYTDRPNFTAPAVDRFNRLGNLMAARLQFGASDKNEGDLLRVEVDLLDGGVVEATRIVDFDNNTTVNQPNHDGCAYVDNIAVEGYQTSNMEADGRTNLEYGILARNIPDNISLLHARVIDVGENGVPAPSALITVPNQAALDETIGFETFPPSDWWVGGNTGTAVTADDADAFSGSFSMLSTDTSTSESGPQYAGIQRDLPANRFEWIAEGRFNPTVLNLGLNQHLYLLHFLHDVDLSVAAQIRNVGGVMIAGIVATKPDGLLLSKDSVAIISDGVWRKWKLHLLRIDTRETTAVLYLDDAEVARLAWDSTTFYPNRFRAGIGETTMGATATVRTDELHLTERTPSASITCTPKGSDVVIEQVDATTGTTPVTVPFTDVTKAGGTSLTTSDNGPAPPSGLQLGNPPTYYELTTTAEHTPPIEVCIDYSGVSFTGPERHLRLFHFEHPNWVDRTLLPVDTATKTICASVTSLSPFAILEPSPAIYVWRDPGPSFNGTPVDLAEAVRLADFATTEGIRTVFYDNFGCGDSSPTCPAGAEQQSAADLAPIITFLHARGLRVEALYTDTSHIGDVVAYNSVVAPEARFDGIRLNIESFRGNRTEPTTPADLRLYAAAVSAADGLPVYASISHHWDNSITRVGATKPAYEHILDIVAGVDVQTAQDTPSVIADIAKEEVCYGNNLDKPVHITVETYDVVSNFPDDPDNANNPFNTFFDEGEAAMKSALAAPLVYTSAPCANPVPAGFSYHFYRQSYGSSSLPGW